MSTYKLIYFNGKGRAELARFIFVQADIKYEDERISSGWMELKPKTPFGSLPVLVEDGKELSGSITIARYLAEKFGLAGANAFENAEIASVVDTINDINQELMKMFFEKDASAKEEMVTKLRQTLSVKLAIFEKRAAGTGWLFGNKLTWADLAFYLSADWFLQSVKDALENFPTLTKLREKVGALPRIAKWIEERPKTDL